MKENKINKNNSYSETIKNKKYNNINTGFISKIKFINKIKFTNKIKKKNVKSNLSLILLYILAMIVVFTLIVFQFSCKGKELSNKLSNNSKNKNSISKNEEIVIGISKIVQHPALDAIEQGIIQALKDKGFNNIEYDLQNANGDMNTAMQIAKKFKSEKVNLAVGIATPTAQALVNELKKIPVIYAAVTDPLSAGIINSLTERQKQKVTGTSDMTPVAEQIDTLLKIKNIKIKNIKIIGNIYNSGESNSISIAEVLKKYCQKKGIKVVFATVTNSSEVKQAVLSLVNRVDAIYLGNDNTVFSAINTIVEVANKNKIPVLTADPSSALKYDILAAMGFNYYKVGYKTGKLIADYFNGKDIMQKPVYYLNDKDDFDLILNKNVAKLIGVEFSDELLKSATHIIGNEN